MRKADNLPPSCVVTKSGNLKFLEPSGPLRACNGTALPLPLVVVFNSFIRTRDPLLSVVSYVSAKEACSAGSRCVCLRNCVKLLLIPPCGLVMIRPASHN